MPITIIFYDLINYFEPPFFTNDIERQPSRTVCRIFPRTPPSFLRSTSTQFLGPRSLPCNLKLRARNNENCAIGFGMSEKRQVCLTLTLYMGFATASSKSSDFGDRMPSSEYYFFRHSISLDCWDMDAHMLLATWLESRADLFTQGRWISMWNNSCCWWNKRGALI